jgi:thiosulfate reductase cytochrome b subunit
MTREEFIFTKRRHDRAVLLPAFGALVIMVVLPFAWMMVVGFHPAMALAGRVAGHAVCIGVLLAAVWFVYGYLNRVEKQFQRRCPHCQKGFAATDNFVLSSGNCYYCGFKVIETTKC